MTLDGVRLEEINISESNYTADNFYAMGQKKFTGMHICQSLFSTKSSTDLDFLEGIQNKSSVKILVIDVDILNQTALDRINQFNNLSVLSIGSKSTKPLVLKMGFNKLRSLTVSGNIKLQDMSNVHLRYLKLINCPIDVIENSCGLIEELVLYDCKNCLFLNYLSSSNVKRLIITKAKFRKLEYLNNLKNLEYIELHYCSKLDDYSEIASCQLLKDVYFEGIKNINDLNVFTKLKNARSLTLFKCGNIQSLSFLNEMPSLERFLFTSTNIVDGDLTPCMRLKTAWSSFGKRHYNIDVKDLPH